ncbi:MAG: YciI family protein, partial [Candidatus Eremiobacter antarcticus]
MLIEYTDPAAREEALERHRRYLAQGRERGVVLESGAFADGKGGMYILDLPDEHSAGDFVAHKPHRETKTKLTTCAWLATKTKRER